MRLLLLFFFLVAGAFCANATALQKNSAVKKEEVVKKPLLEKLDSSKISARRFSEEAIADYSKQKEFSYDDVAPKTTSLWSRFWRWIWSMISELLGGKVSGSIIKYVLIAIAIALVVYLVIKLIGLDLKLLTGKSKEVDIPFDESLENIHEIDFDEQLGIALQNKNYRLVVRLLYLKTLKQLTDKRLIDWQPEKTNQAYVEELSRQSYHQQFVELTYQFEYIWYGEFYIDQPTFESIHQSFKDFNQQTA
ncbi:MAG: DUF4129 domain-containing protein [Flavobacterium sp.]|nr:MAG: DUF4129 domain-containing protein [Flavobacterium sp.]